MLFMENRESLLEELDVLIGNLQDYRTALENADEESLRHLIADGRHRKEENLQRRRNSPSDIELLREISENI